MDLVIIALGGFVLYLIIATAVKIAVKEALHEFKEEVVKELRDLKY